MKTDPYGLDWSIVSATVLKYKPSLIFYRTGVLGARWDPLYDLYAVTEDGKPSASVSLHYLVNLSQNTGEDWTNAKLILSTSATDVLNAGIPSPDNLIVEPPSPPPEESEESEDMAFGLSDEVAPSRSAPKPPKPPRPPLPRLAQSAAIISKSPMTITYTVEALITVPSDGVARKVLVATIPFESVITHMTAPRISTTAYLQVRSSCRH